MTYSIQNKYIINKNILRISLNTFNNIFFIILFLVIICELIDESCSIEARLKRYPANESKFNIKLQSDTYDKWFLFKYRSIIY